MRARLEDARAQVDAIDAEILELLTRRAAVVAALWVDKVAAGVPLRDPVREAAMLERLRVAAAARGLDPDRIAAVFGALIGHPLQAEDRRRLPADREGVDHRESQQEGAQRAAQAPGSGEHH